MGFLFLGISVRVLQFEEIPMVDNEALWFAVMCSLLGSVTVGPAFVVDLLKQGVVLFI